MQQGKALYELQAVDLGLLRKRKRLREIDAQLANNSAVQQAQARVAQAEETLKPIQATVRDLELQIQTTRDKRQRSEERLYSGAVTNPKEMQDLQNESESLKKWLGELEDRQLEAMMEAENAEADLSEAQAALEHTLTAVANENEDLTAERKQLTIDISALEAEREDALQAVTPESLALYDRLHPQKANQPIARMNDDETCAICGIKQNATFARQVRQGDDLHTCPNCKRVLVYL
jgi:uncharacterized protein